MAAAPRVKRIPPKKLHPSKCPLSSGVGTGVVTGAPGVEVTEELSEVVVGVVGTVVVVDDVEVVVESVDVVGVVVDVVEGSSGVVVAVDDELVGSGLGVIVVTSGSPPD